MLNATGNITTDITDPIDIEIIFKNYEKFMPMNSTMSIKWTNFLKGTIFQN